MGTDQDERSTIVVVDDHQLIVESLSRAIKDHLQLNLIGSARDSESGLELIRRELPDVALVALRIGNSDEGLTVAAAVANEGLPTLVLLISGHSDAAVLHSALAAGAAGFLTKDADSHEITNAIVDVTTGQTVISPALKTVLLNHPKGAARDDARPALELSQRETEILGLTSRGLLAKQIARDLGVSQDTVRTFLKRAYGKLGASNAPSAVAEAIHRGLLE